MEEQKKNPLGNIYGSRVSKNGKWLNLLIVTHVDGKEIRITCPIRHGSENMVKGKPLAITGIAENSDRACGVDTALRADILYIPVYDDVKPSKAQAEAEDCDLPF